MTGSAIEERATARAGGGSSAAKQAGAYTAESIQVVEAR